MKRAAWITGAFIVLELLLDVVVVYARKRYGEHALQWIDMAVLPILGLLIVLVARERLIIAITAGATVGVVDSTLGLWIEKLFGGLTARPGVEQLALAITSVFVHPVELAVYALAGGAVGLGIRFFLDKAHTAA